jgi:hypothetical protein
MSYEEKEKKWKKKKKTIGKKKGKQNAKENKKTKNNEAWNTSSLESNNRNDKITRTKKQFEKTERRIIIFCNLIKNFMTKITQNSTFVTS